MLSLLVVCFGLIALDDGAASIPTDSADSRRLRGGPEPRPGTMPRPMSGWRSGARRTACGAERMKHLAMAVLYDPSNGLARGLMGLVAYQGKWERPDEVSREAQDDPKRKALLQEYLQRRAKHARDGRRPLEAGHLVRAERLEAASERPFPPGLEAGSLAGRGVEAPGIQEVGRPLDQAGAGGRRQGPCAGQQQGGQALEADPRALSHRHAG